MSLSSGPLAPRDTSYLKDSRHQLLSPRWSLGERSTHLPAATGKSEKPSQPSKLRCTQAKKDMGVPRVQSLQARVNWDSVVCWGHPSYRPHPTSSCSDSRDAVRENKSSPLAEVTLRGTRELRDSKRAGPFGIILGVPLGQFLVLAGPRTPTIKSSHRLHTAGRADLSCQPESSARL